MARQTSSFKLEGSLGDLCFYRTRHGYFVRMKSSVSKTRIKSDPAYARTREQNADFRRVAHAVKLFRDAFRSLLKRASDKGETGRLMSTMMKVIQSDVVNSRGRRTVKEGQPLLLEGFEFNQNAPLSNTLHAPFSASIDRAKGAMIVDIQGFSPAKMISAPEAATHFRLFSGGAVIDFETNNYDVAMTESAYLPISRKRIAPLQLIQKVDPHASGTFFLLLGIEFVQVVNGMQIPLRDGRVNALAVVRVCNR